MFLVLSLCALWFSSASADPPGEENALLGLKHIWLAANLPCFIIILPLWLPSYAKEFGGLSLDVVKVLYKYKISPPTIDRLLKPTRIKYKRGGRPLLLLSILLIIVGVQLIVMGLHGEMLVRVHYESQRKPIYVLKTPEDEKNLS